MKMMSPNNKPLIEAVSMKACVQRVVIEAGSMKACVQRVVIGGRVSLLLVSPLIVVDSLYYFSK